MKSMNASKARLQETLRTLIPLGEAMKVQVAHLDEVTLKLTAPLGANHNHAGSAFAGSLYSLASLAGWGILRRLLDDKGIAAELLLGKAEIRYARPVVTDLAATVRIPLSDQVHLIEQLNAGKKVRLRLSVYIPDEIDADATLTGTYFAAPTRSD